MRNLRKAIANTEQGACDWSKDNSQAPSRRGILAAWSIWIMLAAGLIAAGLFNLLWTTGLRAEARRSAEAAALAAGHSYLSDDLLRSGQQPFEHDGRAERCRSSALVMADQYRQKAASPKLSAGDVQLSWPAAADVLGNGRTLVPSTITVAYDGHDDGYRIPLFFRGLTGMSQKKLGVSAAVSMEHSPCGFRPGSQISVPLLPFAILNDASENSSAPDGSRTGHWSRSIESGSGRDLFGWNSALNQFESGPDGLPEIVVTLYAGATTGADALIPLNFGASQVGQSTCRTDEWIRSGLTSSDLQTLGLKELRFPGTLPACSLSPQQLMSTAVVLRSRVGEPSLISLCSGASSATMSNVSLTRPVAARIVQVNSGPGGSLKVTLQPCVLVTATAITAATPAVADNRYVYSVRLCQ